MWVVKALVMPHLVILITHRYLDFVHVPEDARFTVYDDEREGDSNSVS